VSTSGLLKSPSSTSGRWGAPVGSHVGDTEGHERSRIAPAA
jgi:hypothetical protein